MNVRLHSLTNIVLLTARWCSICPSAISFWRELKKSNDFEYAEVDAESERGMQLIERHSIASVPTSVIDGRVLLHGVPNHKQVEKLLRLTGKMQEPLP